MDGIELVRMLRDGQEKLIAEIMPRLETRDGLLGVYELFSWISKKVFRVDPREIRKGSCPVFVATAPDAPDYALLTVERTAC